MEDSSSSNNSNERLDSVFIIAIVLGSTGFVLMVLGGLYYLARLGDVPSRRAVGSLQEDDGEEEKQPKDEEDQQTAAVAQQQRGGGDEEDALGELIEIYAPAGKLGVVLEDPPLPKGGPPIVHQIRDTSVLKNEIQVGDQIIALDDEDVRKMTANKVSQLIARKHANATRKLSIIRTTTTSPPSTPAGVPKTHV